MKRDKFSILNLIPIQFGFINLLLSVSLFVLLILFYFSHRLSAGISFLNVILLSLYSFVSLNIFIQIISILGSRSKSVRVFLNISLIFLFSLLYIYHYQVRSALDYTAIVENIEETLNPNSLKTILDSLGILSFLFVILLVVLAYYSEKKLNIFSKNKQKKLLLPKLSIALILYIVIIILPIENFDDISIFFKSIKNHYSSDNFLIDYPKDTYPLIKPSVDIHDKSSFLVNKNYHKRPHIFLLLIESYNHYFVKAQSEDGKEYTPFFNQLASQGLYIDHFYGNSIQTCKGQFAILHSLIPCYRGKAFRDFKNTNFKSLPAIMQKFGYETIYFQALKDLNFDNTFRFLSKNGFSQIHSVYEFLDKAEKKKIWGWGAEDRSLYNHFFQYLDTRQKEGRGKPFFITLSTIMNHMRFNDIPKNKRLLYKKPKTPKEFYANSIHLTDKQLKYFIKHIKQRDYLKNSLIIILGDHGFPVYRHGIFYNEAGYYDEFFRTPFIMIWEGVIKPLTIRMRAHSQIDIAPTIMDLLEIEGAKNHFQGTSIFSAKSDREVYLVQPYGGIYLSILKYPYKYIWHRRTRVEMLFDLKKDPLEEVNIIQNHPALQSSFYHKLNQFFLTQKLIKLNRVYKPE